MVSAINCASKPKLFLDLDIQPCTTQKPNVNVKTERERKLLDIPSLGAKLMFSIFISQKYFRVRSVLISSHNVQRASVRASKADAGRWDGWDGLRDWRRRQEEEGTKGR